MDDINLGAGAIGALIDCLYDKGVGDIRSWFDGPVAEEAGIKCAGFLREWLKNPKDPNAAWKLGNCLKDALGEKFPSIPILDALDKIGGLAECLAGKYPFGSSDGLKPWQLCVSKFPDDQAACESCCESSTSKQIPLLACYNCCSAGGPSGNRRTAPKEGIRF